MWPFKKDKVIDFTEKKKMIPARKYKKEEIYGDYKDFTQSNSDSGSALGFLGSMASSAASSLDLDSSSEFATENLSLKHLKVKMEDVEYKIESLRKKIDAVLDRLDLAEKKIDRNERR